MQNFSNLQESKEQVWRELILLFMVLFDAIEFNNNYRYL